MKIKHYLDFSGQFPYIFLRIILSLEFRTLCLRDLTNNQRIFKGTKFEKVIF